MSDQERAVFYVSDRTGLTVEGLGDAMLKQFDKLRFARTTVGFVNTAEKANAVVQQINEAAQADGLKPLVFSTLVDDHLREQIHSADCVVFDLFETFIAPLEEELGIQSQHVDVGSTHLIGDYHKYKLRMDALSFAQAADDGLSTNRYHEADVILLGASRSGKTPTCLYMAMQYGLRAANYPMAPDDHNTVALPTELEDHRKKLYGLTIQPEQLSRIRSERRPGSKYSSIDQCYEEVQWIKRMYQREGIPFIDSTAISVEEIGAVILGNLGLRRNPI
ncbi:MAG: posphoenolpyruvate synthetase regulatory kinase/phosphorylase PpsR [Gammaproteobacteria bacterium]